MKVYLASSFDHSLYVDWISQLIEARGHTVTVKWWERKHLKIQSEELTDHDYYIDNNVKYAFARDIKGIDECHIFIIINDDEPRKFNGANIELGYAISQSKILLSIGAFEKSVLYLPVTNCPTIDDFLLELEIIENVFGDYYE